MDSDCSPFAHKSPHFFKIILQTTIHDGRLEIPVTFVKRYGKFLSSSVTLRVPTGKTWQVELLKNGDEIWLQKGWQEFSHYHSLKHGHLVVFKYVGDCHFNVLIFDKSAVEIHYENSSALSRKSTAQSLIPIMIEDSECSDEEFSGKKLIKSMSKSTFGKQTSRSSQSDTSSARQASNNFTSSFPSFKFVLKTNAYGFKDMRVPFGFLREHMEHEAVQKMNLIVGGKTWVVNLNVYFKRQLAGFYRGRSKFLRENSLKNGDVCVFELITKNTFNVYIFRS